MTGKIKRDLLWSRNFILVCVANFLMSFAFYLLMPTLPLHLTKVLQLPESRVGIVLSSYTLAMLISRAFSGYLADNLPRKSLFVISLLIFTLMFAGYIPVATVIVFMVLRFLHGAAWGVTTVSGNTIAIDIIPSSRRAEGVGFYGLSLNLSMAIAPWVGLQVYNHSGYYTLIACCLAAGLTALAVVRFIKTKPRVITAPESNPVSLDRFILVSALPLSLNLVLCSVAYGMLISYGVLYGEETGIDNPGILFLFLAAGIGTSRIISGRLVDRGFAHIISFVSIVLLGSAFAAFSLYRGTAAYCAASGMIGIGFGSMLPAFQTLFVNMGKHNQRGTANSTYLTSFDLGIGIGMLAGGIISEHADLSAAYLWGAILCLAGAPYYWLVSRPIYERKKFPQ